MNPIVTKKIKMKNRIALIFFLCSINLGWCQQETAYELPKSKRFIDKVEVFVGPNLSFNYGNKFIENYKDEFVKNTREAKAGYIFGIGAYHPLKDWLDLNLRIFYEQKGTNSQMNTPGLIITSKYDYRFLTVSIAPVAYVGKRKNFSISLGGYFSRIQNAKGEVTVLDTQSNVTFLSNFDGRQIRELRADGSTSSITFAPGLQSFEESEFGVVFSIGYSIKINSTHKLMVQVQDNFGLSNINKQLSVTLNPTEKNHCISALVGYSVSIPSKK
ncbi:MAG: hypothetical protein JSU09_15095 [Bacteroidetes bacterium]|nr:hypothetical protein [Bacteroidota bacterium]